MRTRLQKAIEARGRPKDLRQWSEVRAWRSPRAMLIVMQALLPEELHPLSNSIIDRVPGRRRNDNDETLSSWIGRGS